MSPRLNMHVQGDVTLESGISFYNLANRLAWIPMLKQKVVWGLKDIKHGFSPVG